MEQTEPDTWLTNKYLNRQFKGVNKLLWPNTFQRLLGKVSTNNQLEKESRKRLSTDKTI